MRNLLKITLIAWFTLGFQGVFAHEGHSHKEGGFFDKLKGMVAAQSVVPGEEIEIAQQMMAEGPSETSGIKGVNNLGTVTLEGEFDTPIGLVMRVREIIFEPRGVVAVHQHDGRPGVAYIIEGEITEYRSGAEMPLIKKAGDVSFESTGVTHWWVNHSDEQVRALVVDIVPTE